MPEPLVAKHRRADGTPVVRVETPAYFDEDQAARALALVHAGKPVMVGVPAVQAGINFAAQHRVLASDAEPDPSLVEAYREVLNRPSVRTKFIRHVQIEDGAFRSFTWLKTPQEQATHIRTDVATFFDHDQAARALAVIYEDVPKRVGRMTCTRGLHEAARRRLLDRGLPTNPDKEMRERIEYFRQRVTETEPPMF